MDSTVSAGSWPDILAVVCMPLYLSSCIYTCTCQMSMHMHCQDVAEQRPQGLATRPVKGEQGMPSFNAYTGHVFLLF